MLDPNPATRRGSLMNRPIETVLQPHDHGLQGYEVAGGAAGGGEDACGDGFRLLPQGGGGGPGNNPEQLFAAGYAACFIGAMKFVASQGGRPRFRRMPR